MVGSKISITGNSRECRHERTYEKVLWCADRGGLVLLLQVRILTRFVNIDIPGFMYIIYTAILRGNRLEKHVTYVLMLGGQYFRQYCNLTDQSYL